MNPDPLKLEIDNDPETFQKLITLVNFYAKTLSQYQKMLYVITNLPRTDGALMIEEGSLEIMQEYLDDYQAITAYAQKMMQKETTLH